MQFIDRPTAICAEKNIDKDTESYYVPGNIMSMIYKSNHPLYAFESFYFCWYHHEKYPSILGYYDDLAFDKQEFYDRMDIVRKSIFSGYMSDTFRLYKFSDPTIYGFNMPYIRWYDYVPTLTQYTIKRDYQIADSEWEYSVYNIDYILHPVLSNEFTNTVSAVQAIQKLISQ